MSKDNMPVLQKLRDQKRGSRGVGTSVALLHSANHLIEQKQLNVDEIVVTMANSRPALSPGNVALARTPLAALRPEIVPSLTWAAPSARSTSMSLLRALNFDFIG